VRLEHAVDGQWLRGVFILPGRWFWRLFFVFGVLGLVAAVFGSGAWPAKLGVAAGSLVFCGLSMLLGRGWPLFEFDRRSGVASCRKGLTEWRQVRLDEIAAVQTCDGGEVSNTEGPSYRVHELNLVLADARRINISRHANVAITGLHAQQLAEFLGVPLLDMAATDTRELHFLSQPTPLEKAEIGPPDAAKSSDAARAAADGKADGQESSGPPPSTPIGNSSASFCSTRLLRRSAGTRWLIAPSTSMRVFSGVILCVGLAAIGGGVYFGQTSWPWSRIFIWAACFPIGVIFLAVAGLMIVFSQRWEFDADRRIVRHRLHVGAPWEQWPFGRVRAIQVLEADRAGRGGPGASYRVFEMNLVLRDGTRRNIARHAAAEWMRQTAARLADLLGVPWIDHTQPAGETEGQVAGPAAEAADGTGEPR